MNVTEKLNERNEKLNLLRIRNYTEKKELAEKAKESARSEDIPFLDGLISAYDEIIKDLTE